MDILKINDLNVGFEFKQGYFPVLNDVTFSIKKGETFAIVGESGCGKSMTAMSIINLLPHQAKITSGEILFNDKNLLSLSEKEIQKIRGRKISLIPQDPMTSLNPLYTVKEQLKEVLMFNTDIRGAELDKKIVELFEMVKIPDAKNRLKSYPHEFSGGMKQRVIISMVLASNSELIIADEPTTALDSTIQVQIMDLLEEIKKNFNTSILLISHDLGLVSHYSETCAVMYAGRIVEQAPTKELISCPKHPYTQALISALPDFKTNTIKSIDGQPPSLYDKITGCSFNPRCKYCMDICKNGIPEDKSISQSHHIKCYL